MTLRAPSILAASWALCLARPALAWNGPDPDVRWTAPAACPDRDAALTALRRAASSVATLPPAWSAEAVVVARSDRRWAAHLTLREGDRVLGERDLVERDCRRLVDVAAVVMALSLQESAEHPAAPPPTPVPPRPLTPADDRERPPVFTPAPVAPPPPRAQWRPWVRVAAGLDATTLPGPSVGLAVSGGARLGRFVVGVELSAWAPRDTARDAGQSAVATVDALTASVRAGVRIPWSWGALDLTAGPLVGRVYGRAVGIASPLDNEALWVAAQAAATLCVRVAPSFAVCAEPQGTVTVREPVFQVEGLGVVHRVGPLGFRALLGAQWTIP